MWWLIRCVSVILVLLCLIMFSWVVVSLVLVMLMMMCIMCSFRFWMIWFGKCVGSLVVLIVGGVVFVCLVVCWVWLCVWVYVGGLIWYGRYNMVIGWVGDGVV